MAQIRLDHAERAEYTLFAQLIAALASTIVGTD